MAYQIPWSNFHELNLDWLLQQVKQLRQDVDNITGSAMPSTTTPEMDGVGSPGTEVNYARGDHIHPTDTSRAAQSDLDQEVIDRGNADLALAGDIATVDAKIKLSNTAPQMDDSSATAGISDFMSRADHVHPTDTSRASKSEFDTLKATVDNMSGGANPYDSTPEMDGVGAAGVIGAYARGDHVHPSDTAKLDKTGGTITGNLILQGNLTETQRRQFINVDEIGWLRVIQAPLLDGTRIDIVVVRKGSTDPSEVHKVTYVYNQTGGPAFLDERSIGDVLYIDKIRITDAGRIDIHMDQTAESQICVYIDAAAPTVPATLNIRALEIEGVADAPAGETVLKTYDLHANTSVDTGTWHYEVMNDGYIRLSGYVSVTFTAATVATYFHRGLGNITLPLSFASVKSISALASSGVWTSFSSLSGTSLQFYMYDTANGSVTVPVYVDIIGKL